MNKNTGLIHISEPIKKIMNDQRRHFKLKRLLSRFTSSPEPKTQVVCGDRVIVENCPINELNNDRRCVINYCPFNSSSCCEEADQRISDEDNVIG